MTRLYSLSINVDLQAKPARDVRFDQCAVNSIARIDLTFTILTIDWIIEDKFSYEHILEYDELYLIFKTSIFFHNYIVGLQSGTID